MPTTTDITDWTGARPGDVVLYDGSLLIVDRINIAPETGHPDFLIAHVTGRHLNDDGTPGRITGMSPNARSLIAVRRIAPDLTIQLTAAMADRRELAHLNAWQGREISRLRALLSEADVADPGEAESAREREAIIDGPQAEPTAPACPSCGQRGGPYCEPNPNAKRVRHAELTATPTAAGQAYRVGDRVRVTGTIVGVNDSDSDWVNVEAFGAVFTAEPSGHPNLSPAAASTPPVDEALFSAAKGYAAKRAGSYITKNLLRRHCRVGFATASRLINELADSGLISVMDAKGRYTVLHVPAPKSDTTAEAK